MGRKANDFTGQIFGELTVKRQGPSTPRESAWVCSCSCGNIVTVSSGALRRGQKRCANCGLNPNFVDHTGKRFGRLVARKFVPGEPKPKWECICDCGGITFVVAGSLVGGNTQSCGCLHRERFSTQTHGMTKHPLYDAWINMKQRCQNKGHVHYDRYGARGISVCARWEEFEFFCEDMQPSWVKGLTLERTDVNGNYEPGNCVWATRQQQAQNKEKTIRADVDGELYTLPELSEKYALNQHTLWYRWRNGKRGADLIKPAR